MRTGIRRGRSGSVWTAIAVVAVAVSGLAQQDGDQPGSAQSGRVTLAAGSVISVRIADEIDSSHGKVGDLYTGIVDPSVMVGGQVVIPRGTEAHMRVVEDKKGHH